VVLEASDPANLLCMVVASFFLTLADELCKLLNEVPNFCHTGTGERGVDHSNDGRGKGARVVMSPGRSVQQELLRGGSGFGGLGCPLRGIGNLLSGGVEFGVPGMVGD